MKKKIEYRDIPITNYRTIKVDTYPEDIDRFNKRIVKVIIRYFEKGIETSSITGFNFEYKDNEVWIYQWADVPGEGSISVVKKEKNKSRKE